MKKYFAYLIFASALLFLLPSCDNNGGDVELEEGTLKLTLTCNDLGLTRATIEGEDTYKENTIKSIDCYFYKKTDGFNTAAAVVKSIKNIQNEVGSYTANIKFEQTEFEALFDKNATTEQECLIYVIANYSETLPTQDNATTDVVETSIGHLKGLEVGSSFDNYTIDDINDSWSFVMDSKGDATTDVATLSADKKSLTGEIPLYRTAAKITLDINRFGPEETSGYVKLGEDIYKPYLGGIYAVLHNGVKKSTIAPDVVPLVKSEDDYFTRHSLQFTTTDGKTSLSLNQPLYSYPSDWSGESNIEDYVFDPEAYITLVVPWKKVSSVDDEVSSDDGTKDYYYKVPISYRDKKIERNTYYKINISVSILGTLDPNQNVTLTPSYEIIDWSTETIGTNMETMRYLMVEKNHYVMNNVNEIYIPYWSSHECEIVSVSITQPDLKNGGKKTLTTNDINNLKNIKGYVLDTLTVRGTDGNNNKYIKYNLTLDNIYTSDNFDFAPYTITFTIRHKTADEFFENVTIVQYPAIYGDYEKNSDYISDRNYNTNKGYTFVNGYQGTNNGNYDFFGSVNGMGQTKSSPNRYIFTITSIEDTPYIIGDPRDLEITYDGDEADWYNRGRRIANGVINSTENNEILYYYGTDVTSPGYDNATSTVAIYANDAAAEAAERTINMVAPKFMLASGYAVLGTGADEVEVLENLKKRCASYQEDGYPAGRWRLPTRAEFQFVLTQVNRGNIPNIYITGTTYWCAHGLGTPRGSGSSAYVEMSYVGRASSGYSTRCVYDLWYWGEHDKITNADDKKVFTWGDVLRSEKAYAPSINY